MNVSGGLIEDRISDRPIGIQLDSESHLTFTRGKIDLQGDGQSLAIDVGSGAARILGGDIFASSGTYGHMAAILVNDGRLEISGGSMKANEANGSSVVIRAIGSSQLVIDGGMVSKTGWGRGSGIHVGDHARAWLSGPT